MSKKSAVDLLSKGGDDKQFRIKYDNALSVERFLELAKEDGYDFTEEELMAVIRENGDTFESNGNPPKKDIWI
jgi:predicted ribosomally synthesized peptide with nif11-like leader